jgi:type IX secretion system PorP/SprF family membrane protein
MKRVTFLIIAFLTWEIVKTQDYHFSQYLESPMMVSPALAGYFDGNFRANLIFKSQWHSIDKGYQTFGFAADMPVTEQTNTGFLAAGLTVLKDDAGLVKMKNLVAMANVAYHVKLNDQQYLGAGIYAGFGQRAIDLSQAQWGSQYDGISGFNPSLPSNETFSNESYLYADFGFGINYGFNKNTTNMSSNDGIKLITGLAIYHLTQPKFNFLSNSEEKLNMRFSGYVQSLIGIPNSNFAVKPGLIYNQQGKQNEILPSLLFRYQVREKSQYTGFIKDSYLNVGGIFRARDAIAPMFAIEMFNASFGMTYDINISSLRNATSGKGGMEFNLKYTFKSKNVNRSML